MGVLLLTHGAPASACALGVPPGVRDIPGRVAGFDLTVKHGAVASLRGVPVGWDLRINNDPSWNTNASGRALVGAAFLQPWDVLDLISVIPEPGHTCAQLQRPGLLRLRLRLYENDQVHDASVDHLLVTD